MHGCHWLHVRWFFCACDSVSEEKKIGRPSNRLVGDSMSRQVFFLKERERDNREGWTIPSLRGRPARVRNSLWLSSVEWFYFARTCASRYNPFIYFFINLFFFFHFSSFFFSRVLPHFSIPFCFFFLWLCVVMNCTVSLFDCVGGGRNVVMLIKGRWPRKSLDVLRSTSIQTAKNVCDFFLLLVGVVLFGRSTVRFFMAGKTFVGVHLQAIW